MSDVLETTVDKFTFRVPTDRAYTSEGLWAQEEEGGRVVRIGVSDFLQQSSGDVAFAEVRPVGTILREGDLLASIETIKVTVELASPVAGRIGEVNALLATAPETINGDPYGDGWLARIEVGEMGAAGTRLLDPATYFDLMRRRAEEESRRP